MNFRNASELARRYPGSTMTRDDDGSFVVQNADGSLITDRGDEVTAKVEELRAKLAEPELKLSLEQSTNSSLRKDLKNAQTNVENLTRKIDKIGREELKQLEDREYDGRRKRRHTVQCSCRGEVENCHFCHGRGIYMTDGFGNKLAH